MDINANRERELEVLRKALQIGLGSATFLAGLDKFTNLLTDWKKYLSPHAEKMLPVSGSIFMKVAGVIEMAVGLGVLSGNFTKPSSYIAAAWLTAISGNPALHSDKYYDVAVRDMEMALEGLVLARMTDRAESRIAKSDKTSRESRESYPGQAA